VWTNCCWAAAAVFGGLGLSGVVLPDMWLSQHWLIYEREGWRPLCCLVVQSPPKNSPKDLRVEAPYEEFRGGSTSPGAAKRSDGLGQMPPLPRFCKPWLKIPLKMAFFCRRRKNHSQCRPSSTEAVRGVAQNKPDSAHISSAHCFREAV
jgi:hypothetical protein